MNTERLDVAGVPSLQPTLFKNQIPLIASFPSNAYPALNSISGIFFFNRPCLRGVQNVIESVFPVFDSVFFTFQLAIVTIFLRIMIFCLFIIFLNRKRRNIFLSFHLFFPLKFLSNQKWDVVYFTCVIGLS